MRTCLKCAQAAMEPAKNLGEHGFAMLDRVHSTISGQVGTVIRATRHGMCVVRWDGGREECMVLNSNLEPHSG